MFQTQNDTHWSTFQIIENLAMKLVNFDDVTDSSNSSSNNTTNYKNISERMKSVQPSPSITFMHPGTVLQTRYSEYHTVRVQMTGIGRYLLYAPVHHNSLHFYPSIHLRHRQSQV
jgi:hypothetical protein